MNEQLVSNESRIIEGKCRVLEDPHSISGVSDGGVVDSDKGASRLSRRRFLQVGALAVSASVFGLAKGCFPDAEEQSQLPEEASLENVATAEDAVSVSLASEEAEGAVGLLGSTLQEIPEEEMKFLTEHKVSKPEGLIGRASNFSHHRVFIGAAGHDIAAGYVDLSGPGQIATRDPVGSKEAAGYPDNAAGSVRAVFIANHAGVEGDQIVREAAQSLDREPTSDSFAMWLLGSGDARIVYTWGDGSMTILQGHVDRNTFSGHNSYYNPEGDLVSSAPINGMPAAFQLVSFRPGEDGVISTEEPLNVDVSMSAAKSTFFNLTTGPASFAKREGVPSDYEDAGFGFDRK